MSSVTYVPRALCASVYGLVQRGRSAAYAKHLFSPASGGIKTLSVGGLEVGGVGKTPICALLLRALLGQGLKPGLLSRGYKRRRKGLVVRRPGEAARPDELGDEAAMLIMQGLDVPVALTPRRLAGAQALRALGCDLAVLDDGFAHRALKRDLDVVVLQGEQPLGDGHLLPLGRLREPPTALGRADVLWLHFRAPPASPQRVAAACSLLKKYNATAIVVVSEAWPAPARGADGRGFRLAGRAIIGVAATARPAEFERSLSARGAQVVGFVPLPDHYRYGPQDVAALVALAERLHAAAVVATPKDYVKLGPLWPKDGPPLGQAGLTLDVISGHEDFARLSYERLGSALRLPPPRHALDS